MKQKRRILAMVVYLLIIGLIFIYQCMFNKGPVYDSIALGTQVNSRIELKDGDIVVSEFSVPKASPKGIVIDNYNANGIEFEDERLFIILKDLDTGEQICEQELVLKNQISDKGLFIYLDEINVYANMHLQMTIYTQGLQQKGILLGLSEYADTVNTTYLQGQLKQKVYLNAYISYQTIQSNYLRYALYLLAEIVIGIVIFVVSCDLPLRKTQYAEKKNIVLRGGYFYKALIGIAILVGLTVFIEYTYSFGFRRVSNTRNVEISSGSEQLTTSRSVLRLYEGEQLDLDITADQNNFAGIALRIVSGRGANAGKLKVELTDKKTGKTEISIMKKISSLKKMKKVEQLNVSAGELKKIKNYLYLDFQEYLKYSEENEYRLSICLEGSETGYVDFRTGNSDVISLIDGKVTNFRPVICMIYQPYRSLKSIFKIIVLGLVALIMVLYCLYSFTDVRTEKLFVISFLSLGMLMAVLVPPYCVPDERAHIDSAYRLSNRFLGLKDDAGLNMAYRRADDIDASKDNTMYVTAERYDELVNELFQKTQDAELVKSFTDNAMGNVTMFHYLPSAIGFTAARLLNFNLLTMVMFGRWANLLVISLLIYLALCKVPIKKEALAVLALSPMFLQQVASCSYDGIILASTYLFVAYVMNWLITGESAVIDLCIISGAGAILAMSKSGVYVPIIGLLILLIFTKKGNFSSKNKQVSSLLGITMSVAICFGARFSQSILQIFSRAQGEAVRTREIAQSTELYTASYFMHNSKTLVRIFENTIYRFSDDYLQQIFGSHLGHMNTSVAWSALGSLAIVLSLACLQEGEKRIKIGQAVWLALVGTVGAIAVGLSLLLAWTVNTSTTIQGLQGRYFIPYVVLLPFVVDVLSLKVKISRRTMYVLLAALSTVIILLNYILRVLNWMG